MPADNYEDFDLEINPAKLGEKLVQTNTLKDTIRKFQFYSDDSLLLDFVQKKKAEKITFRGNLAWLSANLFIVKLSSGNGYGFPGCVRINSSMPVFHNQ